MNFRMIQTVIECFERTTVKKIEENSNDVSRCLFSRLVVIKDYESAFDAVALIQIP